DKEKNEHDKNLNETINEFKKEEEKRMQAKSAARAIAEAKKRVRRNNPLHHKISGRLQGVWRQLLYAGRKSRSSTWDANR
ncbi:hypothetical protein ACTPEF_25405, partial [Clostridioides difficile]